MAESQPTGRKPRSFIVKLLINLCCIVAVGFVLVWIALIWLDVWTHHGDETTTPSVEGMSYQSAISALRAQGFEAEILDSVYDLSIPPGTVTDQNPKPGAVVKSGREIYLTITAFSPKMVAMPDVVEVSERQARALLAGIGIKTVTTVEVPGEYKDLVVGATVNGAPARPGTRVPVNARVVLSVASGPSGMELEADSTAAASDEAAEMTIGAEEI